MSAHGSEGVVRALEKLLEKARQGKHGYLVGILVGVGQEPHGFWGGSAPLEPIAALQLRDLSAMMDRLAVNKVLPARDPTVPANRVCYNMPLSPMSFDFVCWLIDAEMRRRIEGAPAPLRVAFWFGRDGKTGGLEDPYRKQMFENVIRPMLALVGAVEDEGAVDGHCHPVFSPRPIVEMCAAGHEVPKFRAPADKLQAMAARFPRKPVTITLREAKKFPFRNSQMDEWLKFAQYLKARCETVIFVRDTAQAMVPVDGFQICPEASLDLHWRLALYESAKMNLFVSNGPASLGHFSDIPWMMFLKKEDDDYAFTANTPTFWREQIGVEMGVGQFPWSRPQDQRIIWESDDYPNLVTAWEAFSGASHLAAVS